MVGDDLWIVADTVTGSGRHRARLHWLCGDFPHSVVPGDRVLSLETPAGPFGVRAYDEKGEAMPADVVRGQESPPRGWLSRYYARKVPVPSFAVEREGPCPLTFLSVLGAGTPELRRLNDEYIVVGPSANVRFRLEDGLIRVLVLA
jgi:asparagine synthase (glutamine-hydrolysing)